MAKFLPVLLAFDELPVRKDRGRIGHGDLAAARVGFDWKDADGPLEKIREELGELEAEVAKRKSSAPADSADVKKELGDLVFAVCNLARHLCVDAESAAGLATDKFARRFRSVEAAAKERGRALKDMTLAEMDALWDEAKAGEP